MPIVMATFSNGMTKATGNDVIRDGGTTASNGTIGIGPDLTAVGVFRTGAPSLPPDPALQPRHDAAVEAMDQAGEAILQTAQALTAATAAATGATGAVGAITTTEAVEGVLLAPREAVPLAAEALLPAQEARLPAAAVVAEVVAAVDEEDNRN